MQEQKRKNIKNEERDYGELPANLSAERALLSCIFLDNGLLDEIKVYPDDFYSGANRLIFEAMFFLNSKGMTIDIVTVSDYLERKECLIDCGGLTYLSELREAVPSARAFQTYLDILKRQSVKRKVIRAAGDMTHVAYDPTEDDANKIIAYAERRVMEVSQTKESKELVMLGDAAPEAVHKYAEIKLNPGSVQGLQTGFDEFDALTKGLKGGQLIVIAARPGCGKTSYAMNVVGNVAINSPEKVVCCFSLEMSVQELTQRMICSLAQVSLTKALSGTIRDGDISQFWEISKQLDKCKVFIDDTATVTPAEIASKLRRLKTTQKGKLDLVVIDYLQLLSGDTKRDNKVNEVADISRAMKLMAKELDVPVILISQMNRSFETRDDKTPMLSDLRDSGAIEQDADMVMFLVPSEGASTSGSKFVSLNVVKNRSGPQANIPYQFFGDTVRFQELAADVNMQQQVAIQKSQTQKHHKALQNAAVSVMPAVQATKTTADDIEYSAPDDDYIPEEY